MGTIARIFDNGYLTSFVSCLCEDGDILSQWRGYANDGKGCSIGFSREELLRFCNNSDGMIRFSKVKYVNEQQLDMIIKKEAERICNTIRKRKYDNDAVLFLALYNMIEKTLLNSLVYKMDGFQEELEWRLFFCKSIKEIQYENSKIDESDRNLDYLNKIDFITKDDLITSYYPLDLDALSAQPIKSIYLGPKSRVRTIDLKMMLEKYGVNGVKVNRRGSG